MDKEDYIKFWLNQAKEDWEVVDILFSSGKFGHSLFWAHLVCEKLCKAVWVKHNKENIPPKTHNLNFLLSQTSLVVTDEQKKMMLALNQYNIAGRYPGEIEEKEKVGKGEAENILEQAKKMKTWLLNQLQ